MTFVIDKKNKDLVVGALLGSGSSGGGGGSGDVTSVNGRTGAVVLTKTDVNLSNVDNTSDLNKPISTSTQTALDLKQNTITAGTTSQYYRGDKTFQTLDKTAVGLSNVNNTSDLNKPISTATQTALNGKEDKANKNVANGYAGLDGSSKLNALQVDIASKLIQGQHITLTDNLNGTLTINGSASGTQQWTDISGHFDALEPKATPTTSDGLIIQDNADAKKTKYTTLDNLPVSTPTQTALDLKANQSTTYTKTEIDNAIITPYQRFFYQHNLTNQNIPINSGSNSITNLTDNFFNIAQADRNIRFIGADGYFEYDNTSPNQKLKIKNTILNQHIEFIVSLRVSFNGNAGGQFAIILGRPPLALNNDTTNIIEQLMITQGQNVQSSQPIKAGFTFNTRLFSTSNASDNFQTDGFKICAANYSTNTGIVFTGLQLTIASIN